MGIRAQLALLIPAMVAGSLLTVGWMAADRDRREALAHMRIQEQRALQALGLAAAVHLAEGDVASLRNLVRSVGEAHFDEDLRTLAVLDADGKVIASLGDPAPDGFLAAASIAPEALFRWDESSLRLGLPIQTHKRWGTIAATYSVDRIERAVQRSLLRWFAGVALVASLGSLALYLIVNRVVVRPVRVLQRTVRRRTAGDKSARAPQTGGRELTELSTSFNEMADALEAERANLERTVEERTRALREANERLEKLAVTDGLTGLYNHQRFQEDLVKEVRRAERTGRPISVLILDADYFKRFNDTHGHPAGDALLRELSGVMTATLRGTDLIARYGGEEFAAILVDTSREEALLAAERLRKAVERDLNPEGRLPRVTVSVGIATFGFDGQTAEQLLSSADDALYAAKRAGRNRVFAASLEGQEPVSFPARSGS